MDCRGADTDVPYRTTRKKTLVMLCSNAVVHDQMTCKTNDIAISDS